MKKVIALALVFLASMLGSQTASAQVVNFDPDIKVWDFGYNQTQSSYIVGGRMGNQAALLTVSGKVVTTWISDIPNSSINGVSPNGEWANLVYDIGAVSYSYQIHVPTMGMTLIPPVIGTSSVRAYSVSNNGTTVGSGSRSFYYSGTTGTQTLPAVWGGLINDGAAMSISADGSTIVGFGDIGPNVSDPLMPLKWVNGEPSRLESGSALSGMASAVSSDGSLIGGDIDWVLTLWESGRPREILDPNGEYEAGLITEIADSGFAVGRTDAGRGFVIYPGDSQFTYADDDPMFSTFVGHPITDIPAVLEHDGKRVFLYNGSAGILITHIPEPQSVMGLGLGLLLFYVSRRVRQ